MMDELNAAVIDWSNFEEASSQSRALLRRLCADKQVLRKLVNRAQEDENLFSKCETHQLLDYLVVYDALERGIRLRIHFSTPDHLNRPHDHRFSFSSLIIRGEYRHDWHVMRKPVYDAARDDRVRLWQNRHNPDPESDVRFEDLACVFSRREREGNSYTLHHSAIHTTLTTPGTISVFLRGPNEKRRSIIMDRETRSFWWRFGQEEESPERRQQKQMSMEKFKELRQRLEQINFI